MPRGHEHADHVGGRDVAVAEEPERHERRGDPGLADEEEPEEHDRAAEQPERLADVQPISFPLTIA